MEVLPTWGLYCSGSRGRGTFKNTSLRAPALETVRLPWALATVILEKLPLGFDAQWGCTGPPLSLTPPTCPCGLPLVSQALLYPPTRSVHALGQVEQLLGQTEDELKQVTERLLRLVCHRGL